MTRDEFLELARSRMLLLDGATGTELAKQGMPAGVCPELWVTENPGAIRAVQQAYAAAGSDIVYTPTFGGNPVKLAEFGLEARTAELNCRLARISREALPDKLIFGDLAPTGRFIGTDWILQEAVAAYRIQVEALCRSGAVDGFAIETMMDVQEARAALLAVRELCDLPVMVTLTLFSGGRTLTGNDPVAALIAMQSLGASAFGCNCSCGPDEMVEVIQRLKPYADIPLIAKPNAGMPRLEGEKTCFDLGAEDFAAAMVRLREAGAGIVGGCCGSTPEHIAALSGRMKNLAAPEIAACKHAMVSSGSAFRRLAAGEPFTLIGERINPTGKKALQAELRDGRFDLVGSFAAEQLAAGADMLDVNFGLSGIDESETMRKGVELLIPSGALLCVDSTDAAAVEAGLRSYPGRALLNSITLEKSRIERILPIAARYGAMLVLLPITDGGIPETVAERVEVIDRILKEVAVYGYTQEDCVVDVLCMAVSAAPDAAAKTLEFIGLMNDRNIATVCGLSNVSFALPERAKLNLAFLGMAIGRGLCAAIANPGAPGIVDMVASGDALCGRDEGMKRYIGRFAAVKSDDDGDGTPSGALFQAVLHGRIEQLHGCLEAVLWSGVAPRRVVDDILIPAMNETGLRFEKREYFLPQLMQSAAAMQSAMAELEPKLAAARDGGDSRGVFVLATVKGDIHDIGKNIVALLLRNHNFEVIDLGKDVPSEAIVDAAVKHKARCIGLSALMTTTMPRMREVKTLLEQRGVDIPLTVGGAAVDEAFAADIGAHYGGDAMATVRWASEL